MPKGDNNSLSLIVEWNAKFLDLGFALSIHSGLKSEAFLRGKSQVNQVKARKIQSLNEFLDEETNMPFGNYVFDWLGDQPVLIFVSM